LTDIHALGQALVTGTVTSVNETDRNLDLKIDHVVKGTFAPTAVSIVIAPDDPESDRRDPFILQVTKGHPVVAFLGLSAPGHADKILFYTAGSHWQKGTLAGDGKRWLWTESIPPTQAYYGTFNGAVEQFARMMTDLAVQRMFYPAKPYIHFKEEQVLAKFSAGVDGVALYDVFGEGRLAVYACSQAGNRLFRQTAPLVFTEATDQAGLVGLRSRSCSFADLDSDGRVDLLAGAAIWQQGVAGRFYKTTWLPTDADRDVFTSCLADCDGDGRADVLVMGPTGLRLFRNPGAGRPFEEITTAAGLDRSEAGAGKIGYLTPGFWGEDKRLALFLAVDQGVLLRPGIAGRYAPVPLGLGLDFAVAGGSPDDRTGGACFLPAWSEERMDLLIPTDAGMVLAHERTGKVENITDTANELRFGAAHQTASIAVDLNADGEVDTYTINRQIDSGNALHLHRGYASYIRPDKYQDGIVAGDARPHGAGGVAAGDVDGDGASDLLLGGADGRLVLMLNDSLAERKSWEDTAYVPTYHEQMLMRSGILSVVVLGQGALGALVTVSNADGRVIARRAIGLEVATGCRSPDAVDIAIRECGALHCIVRWSDGRERAYAVTLSPKQHLILKAEPATAEIRRAP